MCKPARSLDSGNCSLTWTSRGLRWWSACRSERWARSSRYHRSCTGRCTACHWTLGSAGDRWSWRGSWRRNGARSSRPSRCCGTLTGCDRPPSDLQTTAGWKGKQEQNAAILHPSTILHCCSGIQIQWHTPKPLFKHWESRTQRASPTSCQHSNEPKLNVCIVLLWNTKVVFDWEQLKKQFIRWCSLPNKLEVCTIPHNL